MLPHVLQLGSSMHMDHDMNAVQSRSIYCMRDVIGSIDY